MSPTEALELIRKALHHYNADKRFVTRASEALAALSVLEANVLPDGYVAVPKEPTKEMMAAGTEAEKSAECLDPAKGCLLVWYAMLAAGE